MPYIETDDGTGLSECGVIRSTSPTSILKGLHTAAGTSERYKVQDWLSFIGSELHKNLPPIFLPNIPEDYRPVARSRLEIRLNFMNEALEGKQYLMGNDFTVADCYATAILELGQTGEIRPVGAPECESV